MEDVRKVNAGCISNLKKGLKLAKLEVVKKREIALAGCSEKEANFLTIGIQILVDRIKEKDRKQYNLTYERLVSKTSDCSQHSVCIWMKKRISLLLRHQV